MTIVRMKRSVAPRFLKISRKTRRFTVATSPGPHPKAESYPLSVLMRDILHLTGTHRETRAVINEGKVFVDQVTRRAPDFPVGLMDVVEIPAIGRAYRILPSKGSLLPFEIPESEKIVKICKVREKRVVRRRLTQYALHDGRTLLNQDLKDVRPGDSLLIQLPSQRVLNHIRFQRGSLGLISKGEMAGRVGKILTVKPGTFSRTPMSELSFDSEVIEIPRELVFPVGVDKPLVTIGGS